MTELTLAALTLSDRAGLPDDIAYLRADHPQAGWRAHGNYGELSDFWLRVHASLRAHAAKVARAIDSFRAGQTDADGFQRAFVPGLNQFLGHLDQHHRIEDAAYFPKFRALDPRMVAGFDLLERDHAVIHDAIEASVGSARTLLATLNGPADATRFALDDYAAAGERLGSLLIRHLADEEDLVIPAMLKHGERALA